MEKKVLGRLGLVGKKIPGWKFRRAGAKFPDHAPNPALYQCVDMLDPVIGARILYKDYRRMSIWGKTEFSKK